VGQPDLTSSAAYGGLSIGISRYGFSGISGIAASNDGALFVADAADSRVLVFFDPKTPDPEHGMPGADLVLGQPGFVSKVANNAANGVNAATLSAPAGIAVDASGKTVLASDAGNKRALRFIDNAPPVIMGAGTFQAVAGETTSVTLTVMDAEGDPFSVELLDPKPTGVTISAGAGVAVVSCAVPDNTAEGALIRALIVATDAVPPARATTATVSFLVARRQTHEAPSNSPPAPRALAEPQGCACTSAGGVASWLTLLLIPALRHRRRSSCER